MSQKKESGLEVKHYSIWANVKYFIKYYRKDEPLLLWLCLLEILLGTMVPAIGIYLPKIVVDLLMKGVTVSRLTLLLGGLSIVMMAIYGLQAGITEGKYFVYNIQRPYWTGLLAQKRMKVHYENVEAGEAQKAYWNAFKATAYGDGAAINLTVSSTVNLATNVLCFALYSTVLGILDMWMVVILILISLVDYKINLKKIEHMESLHEEDAQAYRHFECVSGAMGNKQASKDIRIFKMNHWLTQLKDLTIAEINAVDRKSYLGSAKYDRISFLLAAMRDCAAYVYLIYLTSTGMIDVGEFVLYMGAVTGFSSFIQGIMMHLAELRIASNKTNHMRTYMELPDEEQLEGNRHISELTQPLEIEFRNVSFKYPDEDKPLFSDFNLRINAGEKIALVGMNGAGKSTLVKLLCGMYDPDSGEILINGINRNEFPKKELYQLFSTVFQETMMLPVTIGENIAVSIPEKVDKAKAWKVLDQAGLKRVFEDKKITLDTFIGRRIDEHGIELSGGQQQRFFLARALYKDAPILVLDEPTAALDPIAESEIYEKYSECCQNKTAIFISHRLASTRFSDRIILISQGQVLESGTHEELMQKNGEYAEMYRIQSQYYEEE